MVALMTRRTNGNRREPASISPFFGELTKDKARDRIMAVLQGAESQRRESAQREYLGLAYYGGDQWAQAYYDRRRGYLGLHKLPVSISDEQGNRIRLAMNIIRDDVRTQRALFGLPLNLPFYLEPATSDPRDNNAAIAGTLLLRQLIRLGRLRDRYADANRARWVIGTCFLHVQRRTIGRATRLVDENGNPLVDPQTQKPLVDKDGQPLMLPGFAYDAIPRWPHQVSWDTSIMSHRIADHPFTVVSCPMTLDELRTCYGFKATDDDMKKVKTMGQLSAGEHALSSLVESKTMPNAKDSSLPGLMVHIADWQDPDNPTLWPRMTVLAPDLGEDRMVVYNGPATTLGRRLFRFDLEVPPGEFLGHGLPHLKMTAQMLMNIGVSAMANHVSNWSHPKIMADRGSLLPEGIRDLMSNYPKSIVEILTQANARRPEVLRPPDIASAVKDVMQFADTYGGRQTGTTEVLRGEIQTHQAAAAIQSQGRRAQAPLEEIGIEDHGEITALLTTLVMAAAADMSLFQIDEVTGRELTLAQFEDLRTAGRSATGMDVVVSRDELMFMPRGEMREFIMGLATAGHLADPEVRRLLREKGGITLDETERLAESQARNENRLAAAGQDVPMPGVYELHHVHRSEHVRQLNTPGFKERNAAGYETLAEHVRETDDLVAGKQVRDRALPGLIAQDVLPGAALEAGEPGGEPIPAGAEANRPEAEQGVAAQAAPPELAAANA